MDNPTNALEDRKYLQLDIPEYREMAQTISQGCILNSNGDQVKIAKMKRKRLKNLKTTILRHPIYPNSLIYKEILRRINQQLLRSHAMKRKFI